MLDQFFSADNFRDILDYENRKGLNLERKYFPNVFQITQEISRVNRQLREPPGNDENYLVIKMDILINCILNQFKKAQNTNKDAEKTFLLFDILACPFLDIQFKKEMLDLHQVSEGLHEQIINFREIWFTKWKDFDFFNELEAKKSKEVY